MLGLDDEDTYLDISTYSPPLAQTASLGLKQSTVRWLPQAVHPVTGGALALAGSWDERTNELSAWSVLLAENDDSAMDGSAPAAPAAAQSVGAAPHEGCVLGLSVGVAGGALVAYTASGAGGVGCYTVHVGDGGDVSLRPRWADGNCAAAPARGLATLGVCYSAEAGGVAAAGEDGALSLLDPDRGECAWRAQSSEPAIFDVCWWDRHTAVTAGTVLALWDVRAKAAAPQLVLAPAPSAEAHLAAQLLCVSADPQPPYRLAAGASDGAVCLWDVRAASASASAAATGTAPAAGAGVAPMRSIAAHSGDVWGVQLGSGPHGQLLSCSSDGTLVAWQLGGDGAEEEEAGRPLVQLALPINSLHLSAEHGWLASASDGGVLTFMDTRAL